MAPAAPYNPSRCCLPEPYDQDLWQFCLWIYSQSGMEALCLELQELHGCNINQLLWCLWLDQRGLEFDAQLLKRGGGRVAHWHRWVVEPLRYCRKRVPRKGRVRLFRLWLKTWELWAERRELAKLQHCTLGDGVSDTGIVSWEYTAALLGEQQDTYLVQLQKLCLEACGVIRGGD